jgi:hypothetical protein
LLKKELDNSCYVDKLEALTLALSQNGRGDKRKLDLLPFSYIGRRGWGMRGQFRFYVT